MLFYPAPKLRFWLRVEKTRFYGTFLQADILYRISKIKHSKLIFLVQIMNNQIQQLVITPLPMPTESMMGLILRTSEINGYQSPFTILRYAGMTENEIRSAKPPIDKLAKLYN